MTQVTITRNAQNTLILIDNDKEYELQMKVDKKGIEWYPLPENSAGWKSIQESTLKKHNYQLTLERKQPRTITANTGSRKGYRDWLNEEDQKLWDSLIAKAEEAKKAAAKKPMTEVEKLQAKIARDTAKLAELKKAQANKESK